MKKPSMKDFERKETPAIKAVYKRDKEVSRELALNAIRWTSNILVEINSNHVGPCFPKTREVFMEIISLLQKAQDTLRGESK